MTGQRWPIQMAEGGGEGAGAGAGSGTGEGGGEGASGSQQPQGQGTQSLLNDGGGLLSWHSSLPENLRSAPIIQRHATIEAAARSLVEQDQLIGRGIYLPKDDASPDDKQAAMGKIYDRLGRPEKFDQYELPVPEGRALDDTFKSRWQKTFYTLGLNQEQAQGAIDEYWRMVQDAENIQSAMDARSLEEGQRQLYAEFGARSQDVIGMARAFAEHFGAGAFGGKEAGGALWEQLMSAKLPDGSMMRNSPELMVVFSEAMKRLGEGQFLTSEHYVPGQNTLETLNARQKALTAKRHAPGGVTEAEMQELMTINQQLVRERERTGQGTNRAA